MAGHSKWANIKHRKEGQDKKRGKIFTKLIREITVSARVGGGDIHANPRLRLAVDKALDQNMTKDTIDRAIKRGSGEDDGAVMEEVFYEGYGPAGVAVLAHCLTDNRNRTVSEVRFAFTKAGGNLGTNGSVSYLFVKQGVFTFSPGSDENKITEIALDCGAEDVVVNGDQSIDVVTAPEGFEKTKEAFGRAGIVPEHAEITMNASTMVPIVEKETEEKVTRLIDTLEDLDDVQAVYTNADFSS